MYSSIVMVLNELLFNILLLHSFKFIIITTTTIFF